MSKYDSKKELKAVYRRCLSMLHPKFIFRMPSPEKRTKIGKRVAQEVLKTEIQDQEEREALIKNRVNELCRAEQLRLLKDLYADLRDQIKGKMDGSV